ncbi:hypothetical protein DFH06DRAFT_1320557 [Mycena polygramma]|nr:hypothetical protein DFH06DRAFT_1320557 [Mycena polygramma]
MPAERSSHLGVLRRLGSTADNPIVMDHRGRVRLGPLPRSPHRFPSSGRTSSISIPPGLDSPPRIAPYVWATAADIERRTRRRARHRDENRPPPPFRRPVLTGSSTRVRSPAATERRRVGSRAPRDEPLTEAELYLSTARPEVRGSHDGEIECGICFSIKSHPVRYECSHSHCFACIRQWLEKQFHCPQCRAPMYRRPVPHSDLESKIARVHPEWQDPSVVTYSYRGLRFPVRPITLDF